MKESKEVGVLFSGGLDSTYLVYKNLKAGNHVQPYYIEVDNNDIKAIIEKQSVYLLYREFIKEFPDMIRVPKIIAKMTIFREYNNNLKFAQVPIWLLSILFMDSNLDEIHIGYIANDDSISYLQDIEASYNNLSWLFHNTIKIPKLLFPISKDTKYEALEKLPLQYTRLIFSCETPILHNFRTRVREEDITWYANSFLTKNSIHYYKICGGCVPCRKILNSPELYSMYVNKVNNYMYEEVKRENVLREYQRAFPEQYYKNSQDYDNVKKELGVYSETTVSNG